MPRTLRDVYHTPVFVAKKNKPKRYGRVVDALFDHSEPVVVGYLVERPKMLYVYDRDDVHLAADRADFVGDGILVKDAGDAWDKKSAARLGIDWDNTVIWSGMPVRTVGGRVLGSVRDAVFEPASGRVQRISLSGGVTADVALGVREVDGVLVRGYRDGHILVEDAAVDAEVTGGAAALAGKGAAVAKVRMEESAKAAGKAAAKAAVYGKAAAKVAAQSDTGKKAMGWLRSIGAELKDAMGDLDDDD